MTREQFQKGEVIERNIRYIEEFMEVIGKDATAVIEMKVEADYKTVSVPSGVLATTKIMDYLSKQVKELEQQFEGI